MVSLLVVLWMYSGSFGPPQLKTTQTIAADGGGAGQLTRVQVKSQVAEEIVRYISVYGQTAPARTIDRSAPKPKDVSKRLAPAAEYAIAKRRRHSASRSAGPSKLDLPRCKASVNEHRTSYEAQLKLKSEGYVSDTQIAETVARLETARAELIRVELDLENMIIRALRLTACCRSAKSKSVISCEPAIDVATFVDNTKIVVSGTIAEQDARFVKVNDTGQGVLATGQEVTGKNSLCRAGGRSIHTNF